jgi:hypothetical protein
MYLIVFYVILAGTTCAAACLAMQMLGSKAFAHFKVSDTKEMAGQAGLRVSAIFGIAAGLIFSGSHSHYVEAKRDLLEEVRLVGTLYVFTSNSPNLPNSHLIREKLLQYAQASARALDQPKLADQSVESTNRLLLEICNLTASGSEKAAATT